MGKFIALNKIVKNGPTEHFLVNLKYVERFIAFDDHTVLVLHGRDYDVCVQEGIPQITLKIERALEGK